MIATELAHRSTQIGDRFCLDVCEANSLPDVDWFSISRRESEAVL